MLDSAPVLRGPAFGARRLENEILGGNLTYHQQIVLQLIGPVTATVLGTIIVGSAAKLIATQVQRRRAEDEFRDRLVAQITQTAYSIHFRLWHFEKWSRYQTSSEEDRQAVRAELETAFVQDRIALGALQSEIDARFRGKAPGQALHRLHDLATVRFLHVSGASEEFQAELFRDVEGPDHTGLTIPQMGNPKLVEAEFAVALRNTLGEVLGHRLPKRGPFKSSYILTGYDKKHVVSTAEGVGDGQAA
jgi:hypothetical protein